MTERIHPPDLVATLAEQVQASRRPSPQPQPVVIHMAEGASMTLVLGCAAATVLQIKQ